MDANKIDQLFLNQWQVVIDVGEQFTHCNRDAAGGTQTAKAVDVFGWQCIFEKEQPKRLQVFCQLDGKRRRQTFVNVMQQFDFLTKFIASVFEQFRRKARVVCRFKYILRGGWTTNSPG